MGKSKRGVTFQSLVLQNQPVGPPPLPNLQKDVWLSYRDRTVEHRFLKWETELHKLNFAFCSLFFLCCFLLHLQLCSSTSLPIVKQVNWPCGGSQVTFTLATLLFWIPICFLLIPKPLKWKYKESVSAVHQLMFGTLLSVFYKEVVKEVPQFEFNLALMCVFPVMLESMLFKIRLKYHVPLSVAMTSLVLSPWLVSPEDDDSTPRIIHTYEIIVNLVALLVMPTCLVALYESFLRRKFERTL